MVSHCPRRIVIVRCRRRDETLSSGAGLDQPVQRANRAGSQRRPHPWSGARKGAREISCRTILCVEDVGTSASNMAARPLGPHPSDAKPVSHWRINAGSSVPVKADSLFARIGNKADPVDWPRRQNDLFPRAARARTGDAHRALGPQ